MITKLFLPICALLTINIVTSKKQCPTFELNGRIVPATNECDVAKISCPRGLEGSVYLKCRCDKGEWSAPNLSECLSKSIAPLSELVAGEDPLVAMRQFHEEIGKLVENAQITSGDIVAFINSSEILLAKAHQRLLDSRQTPEMPEWRENFIREVSKFIGGVGDQLLSDGSKAAWLQLADDQRIDKAGRLMTLLQNMLIVLGSGKEAGSNTSVRFQHYEGYIQLAAPVPQHTPMMINRAMHIQNTETDKISDKIEFRTGNKMELPSIDVLSSIAPSKPNPLMFLASRHGIGHSMDEAFSDFEPVKVGYFTFSNLGPLMMSPTSKTRLNSDIIGAFVNDAVLSVKLDSRLSANFTFKHLETEGVRNPTCVYWDVLDSRWSVDGCRLVQTNKTQSLCSCNHLTSFAILMDFGDSLAVYDGRNGFPKKWQARLLDLLTTISCVISIICLLLCLTVFTLFRSLYNTRTTIHRNLCICLLCGEILFLLGIDQTKNVVLCRVVAVGLHYFFMSAFAWMLLEGYHLYLMLTRVFETNRTRIIYYYFIGFLLPAVLVFSTFVLAPDNYGTQNYCWINVTSSILWTSFLGPIAAILVFNTGVLLIALQTVLSVQSRDRSLADRVLGWLKGSAMLLCLFGTTWSFGFLSAVDILQPFVSIIFSVLNSLQGAFIFVLHVVMNEKARQVVARSIRRSVCCAASISETSQQSFSYQNRRSAGFFFLNRDRIFWWWLLKSKLATSNASQSSGDDRQQHNSDNLSAKINVLPFDDRNKKMDSEVTRKRLLSGNDKNVIVERF